MPKKNITNKVLKKKVSMNLNRELLEKACQKSGYNATHTITSALILYNQITDDIDKGKNIYTGDERGKNLIQYFLLR
jgi:hypothetical protein